MREFGCLWYPQDCKARTKRRSPCLSLKSGSKIHVFRALVARPTGQAVLPRLLYVSISLGTRALGWTRPACSRYTWFQAGVDGCRGQRPCQWTRFRKSICHKYLLVTLCQVSSTGGVGLRICVKLGPLERAVCSSGCLRA